MSNKLPEKHRGFTLLEIIAVIIIIGILATIAIPNYNTIRERSLGKEAIANLLLISAAQKIYRMDYNAYYYNASGNLADMNSKLKLSLTAGNWNYVINSGNATNFTAVADRVGSGGYKNCNYTIQNNWDEPDNATADCP